MLCWGGRRLDSAETVLATVAGATAEDGVDEDEPLLRGGCIPPYCI